MEDFDLTKNVSMRIGSCPNCGGTLAQTSGRMIQCPQCYLGIILESGKTRRLNNYVMIGMYAVLGGAITFLVIDLIRLSILHV